MDSSNDKKESDQILNSAEIACNKMSIKLPKKKKKFMEAQIGKKMIFEVGNSNLHM